MAWAKRINLWMGRDLRLVSRQNRRLRGRIVNKRQPSASRIA